MISITQSAVDNNIAIVTVASAISRSTASISDSVKDGFKGARDFDQLFGYGGVLATRVAPPKRGGIPDLAQLQAELKEEMWLETNIPEVPWELMAWGKRGEELFWALEQPIVRLYGTEALPKQTRSVPTASSRLIILSDPKGKLGLRNREYKQDIDKLVVSYQDRVLWNPPIDKVQRHLVRGYDLVILVGHASYDGDPNNQEPNQFHLIGEHHLVPQDLRDYLHPESLVLFIACTTAQHQASHEDIVSQPARGFVPAAMAKGIPAFIAPLWEIGLAGGLKVAGYLSFYLQNHLPGEALHKARCDAYKDRKDVTWASFVVYQNQQLNLLRPAMTTVIETMRKIGRYILGEPLGQGGQGAVYLATDPDLARQVVVKVLSYEAAKQGDSMRFRFAQEAKITAALEKVAPVLPVYDYGEHQELPYIVMGYAPKGTLQDRLQPVEGQLTIANVQHIVQQIAEGLDKIHAAGIVHRDLKPSNIFFDQHDDVLLGDFGIARKVDEIGSKTIVGLPMGTPAYMSPEQWQGSGEIDRRSDVYALGIILYELFTGQLPFQAPNQTALKHKHLHDPVPNPCDLNLELPKQVHNVIQKATDKSPHNRFATAGALANALQRALSLTSQPSELDQDNTILEPVFVPDEPPRWRWWQKLVAKPILVVGLLLLICGVGLTAVVAIITDKEPLIPTPSLAELEFIITCGDGTLHTITAGGNVDLEADDAVFIRPSIAPQTAEALWGQLGEVQNQEYSYTPAHVGDTITFTFLTTAAKDETATKSLNIDIVPFPFGLCS